MIRAFRACLLDTRFRRFVGIVGVLAFALVVVLGAAHASAPVDDGHDHCGVCVAAHAIGTSESFAAPSLTGHLDAADVLHIRPEGLLVASEPRRSHAPRGPPSLA